MVDGRTRHFLPRQNKRLPREGTVCAGRNVVNEVSHRADELEMAPITRNVRDLHRNTIANVLMESGYTQTCKEE